MVPSRGYAVQEETESLYFYIWAMAGWNYKSKLVIYGEE